MLDIRVQDLRIRPAISQLVPVRAFILFNRYEVQLL